MGIFTKAYVKEKWQHAGFQKYFQNTSWMFFARIGNLIVSFIATAYIARHLGPTNYGELSYAVSFVSIFSFVAVLGIDQVLYRDLVAFPEKRNEYMGSAFGIRLGASFGAVILCILSAYLLSPKDVSLFLIGLLSVSFIFNSFQIITYEFQAQVQSKYPAILSIYIAIILNILKIAVIIWGQGVIYLALVLLLESIFYAVGFLYYRTKLYGMISNWRFDKAIAKKILHDSWPLMFSSAFALIYARIDQIMLKNMIDAESVGLYDAAVRLSEVWYFIPGIVAASLFPAIINAKQVSETLYYKRIRNLMLLLGLSALLIALPTTLLAGWVIKIIFGSAFAGATIILQIYIWSNIATSLNTVVNMYLLAENCKKILFFSSLAGVVTNVILNIYLIPLYGMTGAAVATLISYAIPFITVLVLPKTRKLITGRA
jgi:O-antigen/teichoic acid export membrane protein